MTNYEVQQDFKNYLDILSLSEEEYLELRKDANQELLEEIDYLLSLDYALIVENYFDSYEKNNFESFNEAILLEVGLGDGIRKFTDKEHLLSELAETNTKYTRTLMLNEKTGDSIAEPSIDAAINGATAISSMGSAIKDVAAGSMGSVLKSNPLVNSAADSVLKGAALGSSTDAAINGATLGSSMGSVLKGTAIKSVALDPSIISALQGGAGGLAAVLALYAARKAKKANNAKHDISKKLANYISSKKGTKTEFDSSHKDVLNSWSEDKTNKTFTKKINIGGKETPVTLKKTANGLEIVDASLKNNKDVLDAANKLQGAINYRAIYNKKNKEMDDKIDYDVDALNKYHNAKGILSRITNYIKDRKELKRISAGNNTRFDELMKERRDKIKRGRELTTNVGKNTGIGSLRRGFSSKAWNMLGSSIDDATKNKGSELDRNLFNQIYRENYNDIDFSDFTKELLNEEELNELYKYANCVFLEI